MSGIERRPTLIEAGVSGAAAVTAVAAVGATSTAGLAFGTVGSVAIAFGLIRGTRAAIDGGSLALFLGVVASGLAVDGVEAALVGTVATVVAWDLGQGAIDLGDQIGRDSSTARLESVHVVSSLLVGLLSATVGYAIYVVGSGGQPAAVVVLLLAAFLVTVGLGHRQD